MVVNCIMKRSHNPQNVLARKWMQQALLRLLRERDLSEITVSQLTKTAGVARITFYRNYTELSDILFDYLEMSEFGLADSGDQKMYLPFFIRNYFTFFQEHRYLMDCIYRHNMIHQFSCCLEDQLNSNLYLVVSAYGFENPYEVSALVGMFSQILTDWLRGGMKESIEEMVIIVYRIITKFSCIPIQ